MLLEIAVIFYVLSCLLLLYKRSHPALSPRPLLIACWFADNNISHYMHIVYIYFIACKMWSLDIWQDFLVPNGTRSVFLSKRSIGGITK
jgi:hypothetical protein